MGYGGVKRGRYPFSKVECWGVLEVVGFFSGLGWLWKLAIWLLFGMILRRGCEVVDGRERGRCGGFYVTACVRPSDDGQGWTT